MRRNRTVALGMRLFGVAVESMQTPGALSANAWRFSKESRKHIPPFQMADSSAPLPLRPQERSVSKVRHEHVRAGRGKW